MPKCIRTAAIARALRLWWVVCLAGALPRKALSQEATYVGRYTIGFEKSLFHPCLKTAKGSAWFLFLHDDLLPRRDSLVALARGGPAYLIRVEGTLSGPVRYGHLGMASRILRVTKLIALEASYAKACTTLVDSMPSRADTSRWR